MQIARAGSLYVICNSVIQGNQCHHVNMIKMWLEQPLWTELHMHRNMAEGS